MCLRAKKSSIRQRIKIFFNSQAVSQALENLKITAKSVHEYFQPLYHVAKDNFVQILWIPNHKGFDELANKSITITNTEI